ncbi:AP-5 complex subunit beta-1 [Salarias fasciatus]|uniref:AP-5 complex subunit beta-1 n=1 Tax=Salarias fasciatus TaxID=181472 RepID=A0A672GSB0_SALFA|nr:AP-5 complex subunit beta-1 [Salarias fasciatus]
MEAVWADRLALFSRGPAAFLSGTTAEAFLAELLRELRDDRAGFSLKLLLLSPLCEHPALLCPSDWVGEETALDLMSVFSQCPSRCVQFRCQLLVALTSVLVCTSCAAASSRASQDFVDLLLQAAQDSQADGSQRPLQETACECLRELEACCPGLLSQRLELLGGLRQRETSRLHQALAGVQAAALRNAVYRLSRDGAAGAGHLKALLGAGAAAAWEADQDSGVTTDPAALRSLVRGPMGTVPTLHTGPDCKELRSAVSSLLEESYLLTPLCQAALLHRLTEVVAMAPGVPPGVFRAQLLRLLGTAEVSLLHATLLMKSAFTDSLFSAEDEAFLLRRLVVLAQHPLLPAPQKLFYTDCLLHFPENRPIGCGDGEESVPVLLTPRLAAVLAPTVFNDGAALLSRLNLLCLVCLEEDEQGGDGVGLPYLYEHLGSLLRIVESGGGGREVVVTFFRAAFLFLSYFHHVERFSSGLTERLCRLYVKHPRLAPHLINLADLTQERLPECRWASGLLEALQKVIVDAPLSQLTPQDLSRHLKTLARVAEEAGVPQRATLRFLSAVTSPSGGCPGVRGDWRLGNGVLAVCRRLLVHPGLDSLLLPLADVLQHVASRHGDTDVQDHARLYYTLLTTLSRDKLAGVLADGAGRQVKKQALSSLVAESEALTGSLTVLQTETPVFRLTEVRPEPGAPAGEGQADQHPGDAAAALEAYRAQFSDAGFASDITLRYELRHADTADAAFSRLFSLRLHFDRTDAHYEALPDASVPCLFGDRPPPALRLTVRPRRPRPTTLRASALFSTADGRTWHGPLPDVPVAFRQTFLPLPAPPSWSRGDRSRLFDGLWEEILAADDDDDSGGADSLFCCGLEEAALDALVERHFLSFLVTDPARGDPVKVLLFLPPASHVLMKIRSEEDAAHFHIATDDWQLLPHMNSFLLSITSCPASS